MEALVSVFAKRGEGIALAASRELLEAGDDERHVVVGGFSPDGAQEFAVGGQPREVGRREVCGRGGVDHGFHIRDGGVASDEPSDLLHRCVAGRFVVGS